MCRQKKELSNFESLPASAVLLVRFPPHRGLHGTESFPPEKRGVQRAFLLKSSQLFFPGVIHPPDNPVRKCVRKRFMEPKLNEANDETLMYVIPLTLP